MQKKIKRRTASPASNTFPETLHPVLKRIYMNRAVCDPAELDKSLNKLLSFTLLKNIQKAVEVLTLALEKQMRIVIIGDFDADGATSTCIAVKCLKLLGATHVNYLVPNRFKYGYGLTPEIVADAYEMFQPQLIITVDNGIASLAGVSAANERNIKVLVTDHHLPGATLPAAETIVNPNQPNDDFPSKNLAGVGVIFYVMLALRAHLRTENWFTANNIPEPNLATVLDIVALGTVADVVPLDQNNRILVNQGLKRIRAGHACPGITALLEVANRHPANLVASDLGFAIGPRLNAAGRLEDMSIGIQCLLAENLLEARQYAQQLNALNEARKHIERDMQQKAMLDLDTLHLEDNKQLPNGLCLFDPEWHQGVIGILASRIKDRFHRPVIVFAKENDTCIKGSARSIPNIHIRDVLDSIATTFPGLITKFGGHAMAAGLSMPHDNYAEFMQRFDEEVSRHMQPEYLDNIVFSDGELDKTDFDITLAEILRAAEPWGQAFPEPLFDGVFQLSQQRIVGEKHLKMVLKPLRTNLSIDAIAFNAIDSLTSALSIGDEIRAAFKLDVNEFRGARNLQLLIEHIEIC